MYLKDKNHRITLRLNDRQFDFVKTDADRLGVSPSDYIRIVLNASMALVEETNKNLEARRENDKANYHDNV